MTAIMQKLKAEGYTNLRPLPNGDIAGLHQFAFTCAILRFSPRDWHFGYCDRWCYCTQDAARSALLKWDGTGDPDGWHRHPSTGRRRPDGDKEKEYINP